MLVDNEVRFPVNKSSLCKFIHVERKEQEIDGIIVVDVLDRILVFADVLRGRDLADRATMCPLGPPAETVWIRLTMKANQLPVKQPVKKVAQRLEECGNGNQSPSPAVNTAAKPATAVTDSKTAR